MNLFHGLLFQSGHIADPELAIRLGRERRAEGPVASAPPPATQRLRTSRLRWLLEEMVLLGGRPVSKHHNDDLDEPFPTLHPCS